jgi:hypothetical protein
MIHFVPYFFIFAPRCMGNRLDNGPALPKNTIVVEKYLT